MTVQPLSPLPSAELIDYMDEYLSGMPLEEKIAEKVEKVEKVEIKKEERKEEEKIKKEEVSHLASVPITTEPAKEPLRLPDITVSNLFLIQKRNLATTLTNVGTAPFPMESGELSLLVDGRLEKRYELKNLSDKPLLQPQQSIVLLTHYPLFGKHEVEARVNTSLDLSELDKENNHLRKILEGLPIGPDVVIKDFDLTEDLELSIILSNAGEADLRKGVIFRVRIYLNDQKISDFEHFIPEELKAYSKNLYTLSPPYRVSLKGISKVKVSISPKLRPDDIRMENNVLERRFVIFPFQIGAQGREQFSFFTPFFPPKDEELSEKIKLEVRWEGSSTPLKLSFGESENVKGFPDVSGKSPLKIELPFSTGEGQQERLWKISVTNPYESRVEGHLIVQHP
jgi:hypothetical protein